MKKSLDKLENKARFFFLILFYIFSACLFKKNYI